MPTCPSKSFPPDNRPTRGATIVDVARHAGVSHTTVSWVIHDDPRITQETKEKVMKSVRALNYHPNLSARRLVRGRSDAVALMAAFFSSPFEMEILKGVEEGFGRYIEEGYHLSLLNTGADPRKTRMMFESVLYGNSADALIVMNIQPPADLIGAFRDQGVPLVMIEGQADGVCCLRSDNVMGARLATEHLLQRGYSKPAIVNGTTLGKEPGISPVERLAGFRQVLSGNGISFDPGMLYQVVHYYFEEGVELAEAILKGGHDSVFCAAGDTVAMGLMSVFLEKGVRIPGDIALVGYDDWYPARLLNPSLSTVAQPLIEMGQRAIQSCMSGLKKGLDSMEGAVFDPLLVVRQSS